MRGRQTPSKPGFLSYASLISYQPWRAPSAKYWIHNGLRFDLKTRRSRSSGGVGHEDRAYRNFYPRDRQLEGSAVLSRRDRSGSLWLGGGLRHARQGEGRRRMHSGDGSAHYRPQRSAWSAVEFASWDILGKHAGLPVYNLIGGASRERVRDYANGWSREATIEEGVERGLQVKAMGFTAAKFDPFPGPWRTFVDRRDEDFAIAYVRAMRDALGPEFELLIEAHRRFAPAHAIRIGHRLAEF